MSEVKYAPIWLVREGDSVLVKIEVGGKWITIIREHYDGSFSHIVESNGIESAIKKAAP